MDRVERIREILETEFSPVLLEIEDDSEAHKGHAGARDGKGHFNVLIQSEQFNGKTLIQCHRLVYSALEEMMQTDIHALSIQASGTD